MPITNEQVAGHVFLRQSYADPYYPDHVVDKGKAILLRLCRRIETERPADLANLAGAVSRVSGSWRATP